MVMKHEGLQLYLVEIKKQKKRYLQELDELRDDLLVDNFKNHDYLATERLLKVFTELCISLAKHCLKKAKGHSATDAYQTFSLLKEHGTINSQQLLQWKKFSVCAMG